MSNMGEVWSKLASIDVSAHTEKKQSFTYLSWTWAWATLQAHYPDSNYRFRPDVYTPSGTCEVWVDLEVMGVSREMWLAVTDFRNQPIKNPNCDVIANARMRCLVKAIAMFGLGHYIYAGESLPMQVNALVDDNPVKDDLVAKINKAPDIDVLTDLYRSLSEADAVSHKALFSDAKKKLRDAKKKPKAKAAA